MANSIGLTSPKLRRLDLHAICTGTFKTEHLPPDVCIGFHYFFSTYFDGYTLPEIWEWAKVLPYLHSESEGIAVVIAQYLSDAVVAERTRIYSNNRGAAQ